MMATAAAREEFRRAGLDARTDEAEDGRDEQARAPVAGHEPVGGIGLREATEQGAAEGEADGDDHENDGDGVTHGVVPFMHVF